MPVGLHLEAGHEDVLDDPEALALLDLDHLEVVAVTDVDERQLVGADVDSAGRGFDQGHEVPPTRDFTVRRERLGRL